MTVEIQFRFPAACLCEARLSSFSSTKTTYHNKLNTEIDLRIQLFSIKPEIKSVSKIQNNVTLLISFYFGKYSFFPIKVIYINM